MFGKVKHWLGIEGVKLKLLIPDEVKESDKELKGKIQFHSMNKQMITSISVKVMLKSYKDLKIKKKKYNKIASALSTFKCRVGIECSLNLNEA